MVHRLVVPPPLESTKTTLLSAQVVAAVTVKSGIADLYKSTNKIDGKMTLLGGAAHLYNSNNDITGELTLNGGEITLFNDLSNATTTTIDTVNLKNTGGSSYGLFIGGNSITNIKNLNWSGGIMTVNFLNGSFGQTHFENLNIEGDVTLRLAKGWYPGYPSSDDYPLFSFNTFTGDASKITVDNTMSLIEVTHTQASQGGFLSNGNITLNFTSAATTQEASSESSIADYAAFTLQQIDIKGAGFDGSESFFASSSPTHLSALRYKLQQANRQNGQNPFENLMSVMADSDITPKIIKQKGSYRLWAAPYAVNTRNSGSGGSRTGFVEKTYGMLLGASGFLQSWKTGISAVLGLGSIKQNMASKPGSRSHGKQFLAGITANRKIFDQYDYIVSVYGVLTKRNQQRQGNPSPTQSYMAMARFNTYLLSLQNEVGRVFKLHNGFSLRPAVGVQVGLSHRDAFHERNAGIFAQSYKAKNSQSGEAYTGLGLRKKWEGERFEGKITASYDVGQKSGNGKTRTDVLAGNQTMSIVANTPGRFTQYINVYGSLLDKQSNWKVIPSVTMTLQQRQKSTTASLKFERRF